MSDDNKLADLRKFDKFEEVTKVSGVRIIGTKFCPIGKYNRECNKYKCNGVRCCPKKEIYKQNDKPFPPGKDPVKQGRDKVSNTATKKAGAKKTTAKKSTSKKTITKKVAAKKPTVKKTTAKKTATKKKTTVKK